MRLLLGASLAAVVAGCGGAGARARPIEVGAIDLTRAGVSCSRGLVLDPARGCVGDHERGAATVVLRHRDEMSAAFRLLEITEALDGRLVYHWKSDGVAGAEEGTALPREFPVFDNNVPEGEHEVSVKLLYQGHGYGVFSYLNGYRFTVEGAHAFTADALRVTTVTSTGHEKKGITIPLEERPLVSFSVFSKEP